MTEPFALASERTHMGDALLSSHQRKEFCFPEADETCSFAIPRQSVTVGGHLRAGEKETPRECRAQILVWDLCAFYSRHDQLQATAARKACTHRGGYEGG